MSYQSVNPYDGKVLKAFGELSNQQLERSIETAATCFASWRRTTFAERALVTLKVAADMRAHIDELASLVRKLSPGFTTQAVTSIVWQLLVIPKSNPEPIVKVLERHTDCVKVMGTEGRNSQG